MCFHTIASDRNIFIVVAAGRTEVIVVSCGVAAVLYS